MWVRVVTRLVDQKPPKPTEEFIPEIQQCGSSICRRRVHATCLAELTRRGGLGRKWNFTERGKRRRPRLMHARPTGSYQTQYRQGRTATKRTAGGAYRIERRRGVRCMCVCGHVRLCGYWSTLGEGNDQDAATIGGVYVRTCVCVVTEECGIAYLIRPYHLMRSQPDMMTKDQCFTAQERDG